MTGKKQAVRRLTGDEELSLAMLECCIWRHRQHEEEDNNGAGE